MIENFNDYLKMIDHAFLHKIFILTDTLVPTN